LGLGGFFGRPLLLFVDAAAEGCRGVDGDLEGVVVLPDDAVGPGHVLVEVADFELEVVA